MYCWVANFIPVPSALCPSPKNHLIIKQHEEILITFLQVLHNIVQLSPTMLVTMYFFTRIQKVDMCFPQFSKCEAWQKHLLLYMASPMSGQVKPNPGWSRVNFTWQFTYMISQVLPHGLSSLLHSKWKPKKLHALVLSNTPSRIKKLSINLLSKAVSWLKVFQILLTRKLITMLWKLFTTLTYMQYLADMLLQEKQWKTPWPQFQLQYCHLQWHCYLCLLGLNFAALQKITHSLIKDTVS